jgi:Flp pilus assembly protein TadG
MRVSRRDNGMNKSLNNERGASIVFIALAATALLSMVALAVDVGMLFNTRSESQRAADAAALAGAGSLIVEPENANRARDVATLFGEQNTVYGELADLRTGDVDVDIAKGRVTVTVRRVNSRGNAVPTWFARVFGTDDVDVDGRAVAEVQGASRATCVKPFTIPDMWDDVNGNGSWDPGEAYDPHVHGYGSAWRDAGSPGADGIIALAAGIHGTIQAPHFRTLGTCRRGATASVPRRAARAAPVAISGRSTTACPRSSSSVKNTT